MLDTLRIYEILKAGDIPENQAHAMTTAIQAAEVQINADFKAAIHAEFELFGRKFDLKIADTKAELMRWMFIFWASQFAATAGLVIAVVKLAK